MSVEHLSFLPPIGHWHRAEVEDDEHGDSELVMYGHYLTKCRAPDGTLPEELMLAEPDSDDLIGVTVGVEPRNFDSEVWESLIQNSPLPVSEQAARSVLPPLIWIIGVPAALGAAFIKRMGETLCDRLITWLSAHASRARGNSRDSMVEVQFDVAPNLTVSAFIPFNANTRASVEELRHGLTGLGPVASYASWMTGNNRPAEVRLMAFFYHEGSWHLGWWASDEEAHITNWFERNHPNPQRFLSGPRLTISDDELDSRE